MCKVVIGVVNYKNEEEVLLYAKTLSEQSISSQIQLLVINNQSSFRGKINLERELAKLPLLAYFYDPGENLGYLNGVLYGYKKYIESHKFYPLWFVVSNTDIEIRDKNFFKKLLSKHYSDDIWCIAPSVYSSRKKTYDNPQYIERCSITKLNRLIWIHERPFLAFLYAKLSRIKASLKRKEKVESRFVYSAHGCFFALKRDIVDHIKDVIYEGFLFSEEAYIAETILLHRKKIFYDSSLEVIHNDNSVTGFLSMKKRSEFILKSLRYIKGNFYSSN